MDEQAWPRAESRAELPEPLAALLSEDDAAPPRDVVELGRGHVSQEQLLAVLREQVQLQKAGHMQGPVAVARCGAVANAWRQVVYRQVQAVLVCFDTGLSAEARPNARAALEHAAMLQAFAKAQADGDGMEFLRALDAMHRNWAKESVSRLGKLDAGAGGQHADLVEAASQWLDQTAGQAKRERAKRQKNATGPRPNVGKVRALFDGLPGGGHVFYGVYGKLSEGTHAGLTSAMPYLSAKELGLKRIPVPWAEALLTLSWACWAADDAMDEFLISPRLAVRHEVLTDPLGFVPGKSHRGKGEATPR
jgi:hypothetical protein